LPEVTYSWRSTSPTLVLVEVDEVLGGLLGVGLADHEFLFVQLAVLVGVTGV